MADCAVTTDRGQWSGMMRFRNRLFSTGMARLAVGTIQGDIYMAQTTIVRSVLRACVVVL